MTTQDPPLNESPPVTAPDSQATGSQKNLRIAGWIFYGILCLSFFTFIKLPEDRIKNYIDGSITSALGTKGISLSSKESRISFFLGFSYSLQDVIVHFPGPGSPAQIDNIEISPSLLSLLFGKTGGTVSMTQGGGSLTGSFTIKDSQISLAFQSKKMDLGKLKILQAFPNIQGSAILDGTGKLSGDLNIPSSLNGKLSIQLSRIAIDPQTLMGFSTPKINLSESNIELTIDQSKATFKTFQIGKQGNSSDDIRGIVSGDLSLAKQWDSSQLNLKIRFSISESIMKSFILLDTILGSGKTSDGSYAFSLTGPLSSPFPAPITENGTVK